MGETGVHRSVWPKSRPSRIFRGAAPGIWCLDPPHSPFLAVVSPPRPPCSALPTQQNPFFPSRTLVRNTTGVESAAGTHPKASSSFKRRSTTNKRSGRIDVYDHPKASSVHLHDSSFHGQPMPEARRNVNTHTGSFAGEAGFEVLRALAAFGLFLEQKAVHAAPLWWRDSAARAPHKKEDDSHTAASTVSCGGHTACGLLLCQQVVLRLLVAGCLVLRACLPAVQSPLLTAATPPLVWSCGMKAFWRSPCPLSHLSTHTVVKRHSRASRFSSTLQLLEWEGRGARFSSRGTDVEAHTYEAHAL